MKKLSLFMLMAVGLLISGNLRADNVAQIVGGDSYPTLEEALSSANDGDEVVLLQSVTGYFDIEKNITLNLAGYSITTTKEDYVLKVNSVQKADQKVVVENGYLFALKTGEKCSIESCGLKIEQGDVYLKELKISSKEYDKSTSNFENAPYYAISFVISKEKKNTASLDIESGEYFGYKAIKGSWAHVNIHGTSKIYTDTYGQFDNCPVEIYETPEFSSKSDYGAIYINGLTTHITGGTFISSGESALSANNALYVSGGTFISNSESENAIIQYSSSYISGGKFSSTKNGQSGGSGLVNNTYYAYNFDGTYHVAGPIIAKMAGTNYFSLQDAVDAANGDVITLFSHLFNNTEKDKWDVIDIISANIEVKDKEVTIDCSNKNLKGVIKAKEGAIVNLMGTDSKGLYDLINLSLEEDGGEIYAIGGFYNQDPTPYLGDGCELKLISEDPLIYKVEQNVAQITRREIVDSEEKDVTYKYTSLDAALSDAKEGETILAIATMKLPSNGLTISKKVNIDLNNYAIKSPSKASILQIASTVSISNGSIENDAIVTDFQDYLVKLSKADAKLTLSNVTIHNKGNYALTCSQNGSELTIKSNTILTSKKASIYASANVTINNEATIDNLMLSNNAITIINSGSIVLSTKERNGAKIAISNTGSLSIKDGVFMGSIEGVVEESYPSINIISGVYSSEIKDRFALAEGMVWNKILYKGENAYEPISSSIENECKMQVGGEEGDWLEYATLREAFKYVSDGAEAKIALLRNVEVNVTQNNYYEINGGKQITLDLNGCTLSGVNNTLTGAAHMIYVDGEQTEFIIDDNTSIPGKITYKNEVVGTQASTIITNYSPKTLTIIINKVTIENTSKEGMVPNTITMYPQNTLVINGGHIVHTEEEGAIRNRIYGEYSPSNITMNGGSISSKGNCIWVDINTNTGSPATNITIDNGILTTTSSSSKAINVSSFGGDYDKVQVTINSGVIHGGVSLGGQYIMGGKGYEYAKIQGGLFSTHYGVIAYERGAKTNLDYISGGAFLFDYENNSSNPSFAEFCEFIKPGHYATKMTLVKEEEVEDKADQPYYLYGGQKYTSYNELPEITDVTALHYVYANHEFAFMTKEQEVAAKTYWAVIDAKGSSKVDIITGGTKEEPVVLNPGDYKPIDEIVIDGGVAKVESGATIEVNRIQVGKDGNGAGVIVETDATLIVGLNGLQVDEASTTDDKVTYVIVEAGGTLETNGTIISNDVKEIIIESDETHGLGSVLISPDVTYNNEPRATVYMATTAHYDQSNNTYYWQHFGIPCIGAQEGKDKPDINNPVAPWWTWDADVLSYFNQWINNKWEGFTDPQILKVPFRGYNVTNESTTGDVNYIFKGFLIGNDNAVVKFTHLGYNVMGNSYTAPIDVLTMLDNLKSTYGDNIQGTVWIYQSATDNHISATLKELQEGEAEFKTIGAMQGFILKLDNGSVDQIGNINYRDAVWMNPNKAGIPLRAPKMSNEAKANIIISSASSYDKVKLYENSDYTSAFENGADAPKLMNNALNIYANTEVGQLTSMVSDNLEGTNLSITTGKETTYTLSFEKVNNMNYILRDMITNMDIVIVEGNTYEFTAPANATLENRFKLINPAYVPTDIEEQKTSVKSQGIYTTLGQYLGTEETWTNLSQGVYVINGVKVIK